MVRVKESGEVSGAKEEAALKRLHERLNKVHSPDPPLLPLLDAWDDGCSWERR